MYEFDIVNGRVRHRADFHLKSGDFPIENSHCYNEYCTWEGKARYNPRFIGSLCAMLQRFSRDSI